MPSFKRYSSFNISQINIKLNPRPPMKIQVLLLIIASFSLSFALLKEHPLSQSLQDDGSSEQFFTEQLLDHTDPTQTTRWSQRYHVYPQYFNPTNGTVLLYICGEWNCKYYYFFILLGKGISGTFILELAQRYNAVIFALEHRFYGKSQPFGETSLEDQYLKHLNIHSALDDLAYFIKWVKSENKFGVTKEMPWLTIGGSYPGALSAWFRYKYPHLTVGALASSAVVHSIVDFPQFDQQIRESLLKSSQECADTVQSLTKEAENILKDSTRRDAFLKAFRAEGLSDGEFFFYFADTIVMQVQYGTRTQFCKSLEGKTLGQQMEVVHQLTESMDVGSYGSKFVRDPAPNEDRNGRQWNYQSCAEVGWFQTANDEKTSMRSQVLNIEFYKQWCIDSFGANGNGEPIWPDGENTNAYFGGAEINVKHLIMTNGSEDPWKRASLTVQENNDLTIIHIECDDCAHCVDLKSPKDSDSQSLKDARSKIVVKFDEWIGEHKAKVSKQQQQ